MFVAYFSAYRTVCLLKRLPWQLLTFWAHYLRSPQKQVYCVSRISETGLLRESNEISGWFQKSWTLLVDPIFDPMEEIHRSKRQFPCQVAKDHLKESASVSRATSKFRNKAFPESSRKAIRNQWETVANFLKKVGFIVKKWYMKRRNRSRSRIN